MNVAALQARLVRSLPAFSIGLLAAYLCYLGAHVVLLALCVGGVTFAISLDWLRNRRSARRQTVAEQVPQIIDSIAASLASGVSLIEAFENLVREASGELSGRAERILAIFESDLTLHNKVDAAKAVLDCREGDLLFEVLLVASVRGDDQLVAALISLSVEMRRQQALFAEMKSRQGWTLGSARLGQLSPWILIVMLSFRPETAAAFATPIGSAVIVAGVALSITAQRFISIGARLEVAGRPHAGVAA